MKKLHDVFMKTAFHFAEKSKCVSHHVGAVVVKDNRIIISGINGSPKGATNCCEVFDKDNFDREEHSAWSKDNETHAEMNTIGFAAKHNVELDGCDIYVTISPCNQCLKNLVPTGIKNVYYLYLYDRDTLNPEMLKLLNVEEVPGADKIKDWVWLNNLLYVPKQRKDGIL